jgi:hypothetical protein
MSTRRRPRRALACLLGAATVLSPPGALALGSGPDALTTTLTNSRGRVTIGLGDSFSFTTTVTNPGRTPLAGLVAHLNIVSLTRGVYVDPEDWSSDRTRYLAPLPPGDSVRVPWTVKGVNGGDFAIYAVIVPGLRPRAVHGGLAVSPALAAHVEERRTLNPGGVLPLVVGVPLLIGLVTAGTRLRRGRQPGSQ